jgi:hypothetical protein
MGTNFYIAGHAHDDSPKWHIGKRSAAGLFCWDCNITLCKFGNEGIHRGNGTPSMVDLDHARRWHARCPLCKKARQDEGTASSGSRELGFNKTAPKAKKGVATCASFTWAMSQEDLKAKLKKWQNQPAKKVIVDEYEHLFTAAEFEAVLSECPVRFEMIGQEFS